MNKTLTTLCLALSLGTLVACPIYPPATVVVTYHANGATGGTVPAPQSVTTGGIIIVGNTGNLVRSGYAFTGWNTAADGSGTAYAAGDDYNGGSLDLYAVWIVSLASIDLSVGSLSPQFDGVITTYTVALDETISAITVTAITAASDATIYYSLAQPMTLAMGSNPLTITVTAANGDSQAYAINILRGACFVTEWQIDNPGDSITLPLIDISNYVDVPYACTVNWGDGASSTITAFDDPNRMHTYAAAGSYRVSISGSCDGWSFEAVPASRLAITKVLARGKAPVFEGLVFLNFSGCSKLTELAGGGIPVCTNILFMNESMNRIFEDCSSLTSLPADLFRYNTAVTDFSSAFWGCASLISLPVDLFRYNTAVTDFSGVFSGCTSLASLPADLFRYNTAVNDFYRPFDNCPSLASLSLKSSVAYR